MSHIDIAYSMDHEQGRDENRIQTQNKILKGIKQLYKHNKNVLTFKYEGSSNKKINTEQNKAQRAKIELNNLTSKLTEELSKYYDRLIEEYKKTGNRRKILSETERSPFEKKLDSTYIFYNEDMNKHIQMSRKNENKIDVLEDEKQYFKKSWKNKMLKYQNRLQELTEGVKHLDNLIQLDSDIKNFINNMLSTLSDIKKPLIKQHEGVAKVRKERKRISKYSITIDVADEVDEEL